MGSKVCLAIAIGSSLLGSAAPAGAADEGAAVEAIVEVLRERGLIDDAQQERILARHAAERPKSLPAVAAVVDRLVWSGDLRLRYENFLYQHDDRGFEESDRHRFRYRARLGLTAAVNEWIKVGLRLASGSPNPTSTNQTLGSGNDFDKESIGIDLAFADIRLPLVEGVDAHFLGGKIANPLVWKAGRDFLLWDNDITPEGAALTFATKPNEELSLFLNSGAFIADENSSDADPKVVAVQLGTMGRLAERVSFGARVSGYEWSSLDDAFITRAALNGTLGTAQNAGNLSNAFDSSARIGEVSSYVTLASLPDWPITLYGTLAHNFFADDAVIAGVPVGQQDTAYGVGLELGDKSEWVKLGVMWAHVEANAVVSMYTDSDMFDNTTNREGWLFYVSRQLLSNTDLNVEIFSSDAIEDTGAFDGCGAACGVYTNSIAQADRVRGRVDLEMKF
jgi:hypothetical protein